jgi:hypothetical protein
MEWAIPLQILEIQKIQIGSPVQGYKYISPMGYSDGDVNFNTLCIILPMMTVKSYDAATGRLQMSIQGANAAKLIAFQELFINTVVAQQRTWFPNAKACDKDAMKEGFQPFVDRGILHLYCPSSAVGGSNAIHTYRAKTWTNGIVSPTIFVPGKPLRLAIKIQGLSFHQHAITNMWTGKFRLQHRILAIMTA